ncbi:MAG: LacI family DNA-binding transcriptional regulator [Bacteroidales bacterium]|nr:LacI family DNA-binding transcriptional regulator [Bacteroidales bacterium]
MSDKINLLSIAENTGYSVSTVSRVLSGQTEKYRISSKAAEIISLEASRCHYQPNFVAQALRTRKSRTIGLIVPGIDNPFFATLASVINNLLASRGYHTLLADSREDAAEEAASLEAFRRRNVEGIIAVPVASSPELHEEIGKSVPMVLIDRYFESSSLPYVCTDNYAGAVMATRYLLDRGYRRILAVQGVPSSMPNRERVRGFLSALAPTAASPASSSFAPNIASSVLSSSAPNVTFPAPSSSSSGPSVTFKVVGDAFSVQNGHDRILEEFGPAPLSCGPSSSSCGPSSSSGGSSSSSGGPSRGAGATFSPSSASSSSSGAPSRGAGLPFDAVFTFSTTILLGVIDALRSLGLRVGTDVGVISFDNNSFLDFLDPAVTRVEQPLREAGEIAVRTLFSLIESRNAGLPEPPPVRKMLLPTLIVRHSC